jgi:hypothetical protein
MKALAHSTFFISAVLTVFVLTSLQLGFAQVATSTNYQLQSDSINFGGGLSTSTNYQQESTFGEIGTGQSSSTNYMLRAGYQQMQEVYLSITAPTDITMSPNLNGITGGTSNGSTTVTVTTDSPAGYSLSIESANSPAMQNGASTIADYNHGADTDFSFLINSGSASFGFSPSSVDVVQEFKDNTSLCGVGSVDTPLACWAGLATTPTDISIGTGSNHPDGATTTLYFRVGVGANAGVLSGLYTATTTLTAIPL